MANTVPYHIKAIAATTSTGPGTGVLKGKFTQASMQVTRTSTGTVAVQLEGTIGSTVWTAIGAANSVATAGTVLARSTMTFLVSQIRARVTTHSAPGAVTVWITGA